MKSILEIAKEHGIKYWREGDIYKCYCIFHNDKGNPNMVIYDKTNTFFCFRCQAGVSAVDLLLQAYRNEDKKLTRKEAIEQVYGAGHLRESLLNSRKASGLSNFKMRISLSEGMRSLLNIHKDNPTKTSELMDTFKQVDQLELTPENFNILLNKIYSAGGH